MRGYKEISGCLIEAAHNEHMDVVVHGCNCFCTMGAGIAPKMADAFNCDLFDKESYKYKGDINKLGTIDYKEVWIPKSWGTRLPIVVVNAYTQYKYGRNHADGDDKPLDYRALALCLKKINTIFKGKTVGLPQIGCGLAGGNWKIVKALIRTELKDCNVVVVIYDGKAN